MSDTQRLAEIERKLDRVCMMMETHQKRFEENAVTSNAWRARITTLLHGNNGSAGLMVRVDRLEQTSERAKWLVRVLGGGAITALVGAIAALLKSG